MHEQKKETPEATEVSKRCPRGCDFIPVEPSDKYCGLCGNELDLKSCYEKYTRQIVRDEIKKEVAAITTTEIKIQLTYEKEIDSCELSNEIKKSLKFDYRQ
jgi:hypothetical protein